MFRTSLKACGEHVLEEYLTAHYSCACLFSISRCCFNTQGQEEAFTVVYFFVLKWKLAAVIGCCWWRASMFVLSEISVNRSESEPGYETKTCQLKTVLMATVRSQLFQSISNIGNVVLRFRNFICLEEDPDLMQMLAEDDEGQVTQLKIEN